MAEFFASTVLIKFMASAETWGGNLMVVSNMIFLRVSPSSATSNGGRPTSSSYASTPHAQTSHCNTSRRFRVEKMYSQKALRPLTGRRPWSQSAAASASTHAGSRTHSRARAWSLDTHLLSVGLVHDLPPCCLHLLALVRCWQADNLCHHAQTLELIECLATLFWLHVPVQPSGVHVQLKPQHAPLHAGVRCCPWRTASQQQHCECYTMSQCSALPTSGLM